MTMSINKLAAGESSAFYYSKEIKALLESHVEFLKNHPETAIMQIPPHLSYKYEGDFYGLLLALRTPLQYHWIIMRVNDYTSPSEMSENKIAYLQPGFNVLDQIINIYRTSRSVIR